MLFWSAQWTKSMGSLVIKRDTFGIGFRVFMA